MSITTLDEKFEKLLDKELSRDEITYVPQRADILDKDILFKAIGALMAGVAAGFINRIFPLGAFAPIVAGFILKTLVKGNSMVSAISEGIIIAGIAGLASGFIGGITRSDTGTTQNNRDNTRWY